MIEPTPSIRRVVARIDIPPGLKLFVESLSQCCPWRHRTAVRIQGNRVKKFVTKG
jgi:hypothetical protein